MRSDRHVEISVSYDRDRITERVDAQIQAILLRCAREIHAKVALLSNSEVVEVVSREFVDGKFVDLSLDDPNEGIV